MSNRGKNERWLLAFDGSCGRCTAISEAVAEASGQKLEVVPLAGDEVERWRRRALGDDPAWEPTLLRVRGEDVRAWTGPSMAPRLAGRLRFRTTVRVLRALGRLREEATRTGAEGAAEDRATGSGLGRKRFLQLAGGVGVAAGLTLAGQTPAFAQSETSRARAWVAANKDRLPAGYDDVVRYSEPYRKAILRAKPPQERARLWMEQVRRYRETHPDLSREQTAVLDEAVEMIPRHFVSGGGTPSARLKRLEESAEAAFGKEETGALLARLGPPDTAAGPPAYCFCATESDYCSTGSCHRGGCTIVEEDCGSLYAYDCNGQCA
ncbi:bacteriocin fulvocin C-related protein [Streptomyces phytohabitans]|uniref:bacteriocin fulvocin C-related protein n=1 Tax=Streptomyces phytohabitans TaxID=1150371 RepID=UPI00345C5172